MGEERTLGIELATALWQVEFGYLPVFRWKDLSNLVGIKSEDVVFFEPKDLKDLKNYFLKPVTITKNKRDQTIQFPVGTNPNSPFTWIKSQTYKTGPEGELAGFFSGVGSQNIPKIRYATRLLQGYDTENTVKFWEKVFEREYNEFMGSEIGSYIYDSWHVLAHTAVLKYFNMTNHPLAIEAKRWLSYWLTTAITLSRDGKVYWPGMRSAGKLQLPGLRELIVAEATSSIRYAKDNYFSNTPTIETAWEWGRKAGLGLNLRWEYYAILAVSHELIAAIETPATSDRKRLWRVPVEYLECEDGTFAVWCLSPWNVNGNTPPVLARIRSDIGEDISMPYGGGWHLRQQFDNCSITLTDGVLQYDSELYGKEQYLLPETSSDKYKAHGIIGEA